MDVIAARKNQRLEPSAAGVFVVPQDSVSVDRTLAEARGRRQCSDSDKSVNYKGLRGIRTYDITDPTKPILLEEFSTGEKGNGTHHNFYDGGKYAYLDCGWDDQLRLKNHQRPFSNALMIVDMSDPSSVKEVSRWWVPGQRLGEEEEYRKYVFAGDGSL
jgi:hypothetical protein